MSNFRPDGNFSAVQKENDKLRSPITAVQDVATTGLSLAHNLLNAPILARSPKGALDEIPHLETTEYPYGRISHLQSTYQDSGPSNDTFSNDSPVIVYLLTDRPKNRRVHKLIEFFRSRSYFQLIIKRIPPQVKVEIPNGMNIKQAIEICRFEKVLKDAFKRYPDNYVLVIKDTSIATDTPQALERIIRKARQFGEWDVFYLSRWLDLCNLYKDEIKVENSMKVIVRTFSPNGTQALLFSPEGRDTILGKRKMKNGEYFTPIRTSLSTKLNTEISDKNISALCVVPNEFEFNIFEATRTSDFAKVSDCRRPEPEDVGPGAIPFMWFIVIVVVAILIAWALYNIGPSYHGITSAKKKPVQSSS